MRLGAAVARRYAKALRVLAAEAHQLEPVGEELATFEGLLETEPTLREALLRPWVKAGTKRQIARAVGERLGLSPLTQKFLALVAQRRRLPILPDILAAYRELVDEAAGRARARVRSAAPLTEATQGAIRERLGRRLGKTVILETRVDPSLLGGFVAEVGGRVLDASLTGQLAALRERLTRDGMGAA